MPFSLILWSAAAVMMLTALVWLIRRGRQQQIGLLALQEEIIQLRDLLHAQGSANTGLRKSLQQLKSGLAGVAEKLDQLENDSSVGGGSSLYRQAINLAVDGAEPAELSQRFGLSRGEAELLVSFHQLSDQVSDRAA